MAGFFCFTRKILTDIEMLNPIGFKIGLEVIVKTSPKKILEIPIEFKERLHGESKLSMKEQINYLIHLERLMEYKYKTAVEFIKFSLIGGVWMIIDLTSVHISYGILAVPFRISRVIGFMLAVTSNFLLNRKFTFTHAQAGDVRSQYIKFLITAVVAFVVNWFISVYLFENFELFNRLYLLAAFVGIIGGLVINFVGSKFIVFKTARRDVKSA
jgi:dolichol-phosphate mannosyltransferase